MKTHIKIPKSEKHSKAIVCGSPERAAWFASLLDESRPVAKNREYHSYLGKYRGVKILVMSHGVGSAGAGICFQELIDAGAKEIVRIGTAGGFLDGMQISDIIVATGAVRKDGTSALMVPLEFPAIADLEMTQRLLTNLNSKKCYSGVVLTTDLFYPGVLDSQYRLFKEAGAVAVEMECATLFITAHLRRVRAASVLVSDGNPLEPSSDSYDPDPDRLKNSMEACFFAAAQTLLS